MALQKINEKLLIDGESWDLDYNDGHWSVCSHDFQGTAKEGDASSFDEAKKEAIEYIKSLKDDSSE